MNLAIVGCRNFNNYELFSSHVDQWIREHEMPEMIISGGATGADNLAERYAHEHSIPITIFAPQHNLYGSNSYRMRNQQIVNASTHLIAFPSQASKGTWMTINMAHRNGISPTVIKI
jgi:nucleoside-diphosphate-sugar epimerase